MLRPMLFIGVGGSGGKTLRTISNSLSKLLHDVGYTESIPDVWQFLHIDLPVIQDGTEYPAPFLTSDQYHSVVKAGMVYKDLLNKVSSLGDKDIQQNVLAGWARPLPNLQINMPPSMDRAIGRLAGLSDIPGIKMRIRNSIAQMQSPAAQSGLQRLAERLPEIKMDLQPEVVIISSSVGGSGSGMFLDIAEILKRTSNQAWLQSPKILLYTPEIFESLRYVKSSMAANHLGVMNEIITESYQVKSQCTELAYERSGLIPVGDFAECNHYYFLGVNKSDGAGTSFSSQINEMDNHFHETGISIANAITQGLFWDWLEKIPFGSHTGSQSLSNAGWARMRTGLTIWEHSQLTSIILEEATRAQNSREAWSGFWEGHRTRPLIEAVPLTNEVRRSIITGWFLSSLFGLRDIEYREDRPIVRIWNSMLSLPSWSTFRDPLPYKKLEDNRREWLLPAVLKSIAMALCEQGATGNSEPLEAVEFLLFLGQEVVTPIQSQNPRNSLGLGSTQPIGKIEKSNLISDWINTGIHPAPNGSLNALLSENLKTMANRREALRATIEEIRMHHKKVWQEYESTPWSELPETWELREDIDQALSRICDFVS